MDGMTMTDDQTTNTAGETPDLTAVRDEIESLLDEFEPIASTRLAADEIVNRILYRTLARIQRKDDLIAEFRKRDEVHEKAIVWQKAENQRLLSELGTAREMRPPTGMWQVSVRVPMDLPREMRDSLSEALAAAVHDWEPQDRDGWDVEVSGHPTYQPCPDARAHKEASDG